MPKFFSSIFFKLMMIILLAGLGINVAIILFFGAFRHHVAKTYYPHLNRYIDYLINDIGDPPNQTRARKIAEQTEMVIAYDGADQAWTTVTGPIDFPMDRMRIRHRDSRMEAASYHGTYRVSVQLAKGRLTFFLSHRQAAENKIKALSLGLLSLITLLMVAAYFGIRWVLKPLRGLKKGVDQVSRGDLSHRIPLKRNDELKDLSDAFNTMTVRLQHLVSAKEQLLLDVSHELRTPVTRIKVALAMLPASPDRDSIMEDIKEIEEKITELLETARSLNIAASPAYGEADLSALIRSTARQFESGLPAIHMEALPETLRLQIDAEQIGRALKNVVDNAQKYSPDDADPIQISVETDAAMVSIIIKDHGIGIPDEDCDFIFEPFYRADKARTPRRDGYGLGLSLTRNIVEAHGGDINISSTLERGTTVRIRLPLTPP